MVDGDWVESKDQDPNGDVRLIQLADVGAGRFIDKSNRWLTSERAAKLNCKALITGDLLISRLGDPLGKACIFPQLDSPCVTVVDVHIFRSGTPKVSHRWLMHALNSHTIRADVESQSSGATRKRITGQKLKDLEVPIPPPAEQQRIASRVDELFSSIDAGERALKRVRKLVERYRQSVLKAAVTGELTREWREKHAGELESGESLLTRVLEGRRKAWEKSELDKMKAKGQRPANSDWKKKYKEPAWPDTSDLPELPEGWVWARAEQVCDFITKGTTPAAADMVPGTGEVPYIKVYNLTFDGTLDFTKDPTFISRETHRETLKRSCVVPGDVLMNIVGPPLGKVSIVPTLYPEWNMNQAVAVFRPLKGLDRNFLAFFLLSRAAQDWYKGKAKATAGQFNLTLEICRDTPIPFPSQEEQLQIQQLISVEQSRLDALASFLDQQSRHTLALRQSVLNTAFSGALVAQDPADEPPSALLNRIAAERHPAPKRTAANAIRWQKVKA
jgi:type I restriction enzyme S subunit